MGVALLLGTGGARQLSLALSHGLSSQIDLVCVIDKPIKDGVSQYWVTNDRMPLIDKQLACGHRSAGTVPDLQDLQRITPVLSIEFHQAQLSRIRTPTLARLASSFG